MHVRVTLWLLATFNFKKRRGICIRETYIILQRDISTFLKLKDVPFLTCTVDPRIKPLISLPVYKILTDVKRSNPTNVLIDLILRRSSSQPPISTHNVQNPTERE